MEKKLTPSDLREIFVKLQDAKLDAVVVGGQAVNLWAFKYCEDAPLLKQLLPFASEDLDFYGGKLEVLTCKDVLQGRATLNQDFDPSPNSGVVIVNYQDQNLRIDFLASVYGLNDAEITSTALPFSGGEQMSGVNIKVLHPLLCLEGKLKCLRGLPQQGRQDLKHVKMSLLCVGELLKDFCQQQEPRAGLKLIERVLKDALTEDGLSAWYKYEVQVESAIPVSTLRQLSNEKWQKFCEIRFPKAIEQISVKRNHYLEVMNRIVSRTQNKEVGTKDKQLSGSQAITIQATLILVEQILDALNTNSYENNDYSFKRQGETLTIAAKDGRGIILQNQPGQFIRHLSMRDFTEINQLANLLGFQPKRQQQEPEQLSDEELLR